ncbi:MAG TPA: flippase, partial [Vibrio sp.]|nr:flippase [Vibrio sp.]
MIKIVEIKSLLRNSGVRRYLANTSWMMGEQVLRIIAGLVVGTWVARYLGPDRFGVFSYVMAFTSIFGGLAKLGLDGIVVRELINRPEKCDVYLGSAFWLKLLGSILVVLLVLIILPFTNNDSSTNFLVLIVVSGFVLQTFEVIDFYFQSQVLSKITSICKTIQLSLSSIIKIYL